jgi:hypothetical protein
MSAVHWADPYCDEPSVLGAKAGTEGLRIRLYPKGTCRRWYNVAGSRRMRSCDEGTAEEARLFQVWEMLRGTGIGIHHDARGLPSMECPGTAGYPPLHLAVQVTR